MKKILLILSIIAFLSGFVFLMNRTIQKEKFKMPESAVEKKIPSSSEPLNLENKYPTDNSTANIEQKYAEKNFHTTPEKKIIKKSENHLTIVIDDCGGNIRLLEKFLELDCDLMFAVIPDLPHSSESFKFIKKFSRKALIHLPMEPSETKLIEKQRNNFILTSMTDNEIVYKVDSILKKYPLADGLNNHMGSKATADIRVCEALLSSIHKYNYDNGKKLFFFDSKTTPVSVIPNAAKRFGVKYFVNNGFIDNENDENKILERIRHFQKISERTKEKLFIIGHLRPNTYSALKQIFSL